MKLKPREPVSYLKDLLDDFRAAASADEHKCTITCGISDVINIKHVIELLENQKTELSILTDVVNNHKNSNEIWEEYTFAMDDIKSALDLQTQSAKNTEANND